MKKKINQITIIGTGLIGSSLGLALKQKKIANSIIGIDKTTDVALLKLVGDNFPYAKVGDSDDLIIGEWAIAIGNP